MQKNLPLALPVFIALIGSILESSLLVFALILVIPCLVARALPKAALRVWSTFATAWTILCACILVSMNGNASTFWDMVPNEITVIALLLSSSFAVVSVSGCVWAKRA